MEIIIIQVPRFDPWVFIPFLVDIQRFVRLEGTTRDQQDSDEDGFRSFSCEWPSFKTGIGFIPIPNIVMQGQPSLGGTNPAHPKYVDLFTIMTAV